MSPFKGKFPRSVPVHNYRVPVVWKHNLSHEEDDEEIPVYGLYHWAAPKPRIEINADCEYELAFNTFCHEILHAWMHTTGLISKEAEEVAVRALTPLLVQLLKEWDSRKRD